MMCLRVNLLFRENFFQIRDSTTDASLTTCQVQVQCMSWWFGSCILCRTSGSHTPVSIVCPVLQRVIMILLVNDFVHMLLWAKPILHATATWHIELGLIPKYVHECERGLSTLNLMLRPCWLHHYSNSNISTQLFQLHYFNSTIWVHTQADKIMKIHRDYATLNIQSYQHIQLFEYG